MEWYDRQTKWIENQNYDNPDNTSKQLHDWYYEMISSYPTINSPNFSDDDENYKYGDYSIGQFIIYFSLPWPEADNANKMAKGLAVKYNVGFYDVSGGSNVYYQLSDKVLQLKWNSFYRSLGVLGLIGSLGVLVYGLLNWEFQSFGIIAAFILLVLGLGVWPTLYFFVANLRANSKELINTSMFAWASVRPDLVDYFNERFLTNDTLN